MRSHAGRRPQLRLRPASVGLVAALLPVAALVFILVTLLLEAWPAIRLNGTGFLTTTTWRPGDFYGNGITTHGVAHPPGSHYGATALLVGTLASSVIALLVGVPVAVGAAIALTDRMPRTLGSFIGYFLELLAGIPSVIIGLWGALTFGPVIAHDIAPVISRHVPDVPPLSYLRGDTGNGEGLLTSGLILAIMVIPIIAATTRDLLRQVPVLPREGAYALGLSDWEVTRRVTLRWVAGGVVGAIVLGLGRALGETMAVAMVSGVVLGAVPHNLYATMSTISATIVSQLDSALTDSTGYAVRTLAELGLLLMLSTLLVNLAARVLIRRVTSTALPVGRGI